jgi:hypothetical protein
MVTNSSDHGPYLFALSRMTLRSNRGDSIQGQLVSGPCGSTTCEKESSDVSDANEELLGAA